MSVDKKMVLSLVKITPQTYLRPINQQQLKNWKTKNFNHVKQQYKKVIQP